IFEGRFYSFSPKSYLDKTGLTLIRPLMYASEYDIKGFQNKMDLPVAKNPCPVDGHTKRQYVKDLINGLNKEYPGIRERFFTAILEGNIKGWPIRNPKKPRTKS
ncbi:MAG: tRNA 2-thiocytidine(32) synthetase TtcA, partial [Lachnospiraceae bacterium]|nr:tRNA 2-thiocytidine(32) synthetase TtcA [Lachnospiraceae bacterium]